MFDVIAAVYPKKKKKKKNILIGNSSGFLRGRYHEDDKK